MIYKFTVKPDTTHPSPTVLLERTALQLPDLEVWKDYYIEVLDELTEEQTKELASAFCDPVVETVVVGRPLESSGMVQVAHRSGIVDNESASICNVCELFGIPAVAGKVATTFCSSSGELLDRIRALRYNENIEELHTAEPSYETLTPRGYYAPAERFDLLDLDDEELAEIGSANGRNLDLRQMRQVQAIQRSLGEQVTDVLLEAVDARWSDHCSHTTWRSLGDLLGKLKVASRSTSNVNIISMFHDNAGVWRLNDKWGIALKAETHNGPSAVSAYFGQLTKLGGVLRDILGTGLGADPIGCFEFTATGAPEDSAPIPNRPSPKQIATETIRAIKEYGNTFGVPMMWSKLTFHPAYRAKPFALGGSIGLIPLSKAQRGVPANGDVVLLIGGLTGNEGIHGASSSSAGASMDEAAVQIGSPLEQVKFRKAIIDLRDADCLDAITDVGGAGLNSAVGEMGEQCGVWLNTALVPLKTSSLPMWRILLSESQERMILAVPRERLADARGILDRHLVRHTAIGRFTDTNRYCVFHDPELSEAAVVDLPAGEMPAELGEKGFDVSYDLLEDHPEQRKVGRPPVVSAPPAVWPDLDGEQIVEALRAVLEDPEVCSQAFSDDQYDSTVQGNTLVGPKIGERHKIRSSWWASTPVDGSDAVALVATAFNPWLFESHPVRAVRQLFLGLVGTLVLAGSDVGDICVCDNFYTPDLEPSSYEWLVAMVDELTELVTRLGVPIISGKDSSAGSTMTSEGIISVPPAVFLTGLGRLDRREDLLPQLWREPGHLIVRIGPSCGSAAATVLARKLDLDGGVPDEIDVPSHARYLVALCESRRLFQSGTTIGPGGVIAGVMTQLFASSLGAELAVELDCESLFAEHRCGALVEVREPDLADLHPDLDPVVIGRIADEPGLRIGDTGLPLDYLERRWSAALVERLA